MKYENAPRFNFILHTSYFILFLSAVALYGATMNPDVQPADSGELQLAAITLGIPHPPGYPLFTLLGWLFAQVPIGSPFARVTFLSVVASAGALVLVAACVSGVRREGDEEMRRCKDTASSSPYLLISSSFAALLAAFTLGTSTTFWAQATTTNIRSLTAFFTAFMVFAVIRFRLTAHRSWLIAFALALGLGVGHHVSLVFIGAVFGVFVLGMAIRARLPLKDFIVAGLVLAATQLVWLYLPLRNSAISKLDHGNLATLQGFLDHVLARGFEGDLFYFIRTEPALFWDRLALTPTLLQFQFSLPVLVLMALAAVMMLWRERTLGFVLLFAFALHGFITLTYRAPQTVEYAMPCWVIACVVLGLGIRDWGLGIGKLKFPNPQSPIPHLPSFLRFFVFILLAFFPARDCLARLPSFVQLSRDRSTRANAEAVLRIANPNHNALSNVFSQWHQATPMWALQAVEHISPAVRVNYVYPQGAEPYETTFAKRTAASAQQGNTYVTSFYEAEFGKELLQTVPLSNTPAWRVAPEIGIASASFPRTVWDDRIILVHPLGLPKQVEIGTQFPIDLWWSSRGAHIEGDSITVRILRRDGRLATNADVRLTGSEGGGVVMFKRAVLAIPLDLEPGEYDVLAGAYNGVAIYKTRDAVGFVRVGELTVVPATQMPVTRHSFGFEVFGGTDLRSASTMPTLIGVDYDTGISGVWRLFTHWKLGKSQRQVVVGHVKGSFPDELFPLLSDTKTLISSTSSNSNEYVTLVFSILPTDRLFLELKEANAESLRETRATINLPAPNSSERYIPFANQMILIGSRAQRNGTKLTIDLRWLALQPITEDYKISVRIKGNNFYKAHDGVPALGAIPTLKWIRGSEITDRHVFDLGEYNGPLEAEVVVYDNVTRLPLIPLDERYTNGVTIGIGE